jgi:hypothetical protein
MRPKSQCLTSQDKTIGNREGNTHSAYARKAQYDHHSRKINFRLEIRCRETGWGFESPALRYDMSCHAKPVACNGFCFCGQELTSAPNCHGVPSNASQSHKVVHVEVHAAHTYFVSVPGTTLPAGSKTVV